MATLNLQSYQNYFLGEHDLKTMTFIREDVEPALLKPVIKLASDYYIYKLLGSNLYVDLQTKIQAKTLNINENELINVYIRDTLAWACMKMAPIFISLKYTNRGVVKMTGQNSAPAETSDLQMLGDWANQYYELYADRLVKYLIANAQNFPAYRVMTAYNDVSPATDGWNPRIALGNRPRVNNYLQSEAGGVGAVSITQAMISYFNVSIIKTATSHTGNTATFPGAFLQAPAGLPVTSQGNFTFYCNSTLIPASAVSMFVDNGNGTCTLAVDTTILGYSFQGGDVISSSGKYAS